MGQMSVERLPCWPTVPSRSSVKNNRSRRTQLTCGHYGLVATGAFDIAAIGDMQICEVCGEPRYIVYFPPERI